MLVPEPLRGVRVVADASALDALVAAPPIGATILRFAPDEAFVIDASDVAVDDPHAIVEPEAGFVALTVDREVVERHTEWRLPAADPGSLAQGAIAGVPAKLTWRTDGRARIVTHGAYVADLVERLR